MARYTGAKLRVTRRLGDLPAFTSKKSKSTQRPGQHGATPKKLMRFSDHVSQDFESVSPQKRRRE